MRHDWLHRRVLFLCIYYEVRDLQGYLGLVLLSVRPGQWLDVLHPPLHHLPPALLPHLAHRLQAGEDHTAQQCLKPVHLQAHQKQVLRKRLQHHHHGHVYHDRSSRPSPLGCQHLLPGKLGGQHSLRGEAPRRLGPRLHHLPRRVCLSPLQVWLLLYRVGFYIFSSE